MRALLEETYDKNMIDKDEYPQTAEIERRCVNIIGDLWNATDAADAVGTSTAGSSEAFGAVCFLAGGALLMPRLGRARALPAAG